MPDLLADDIKVILKYLKLGNIFELTHKCLTEISTRNYQITKFKQVCIRLEISVNF